jgi:hypothetical protein
MNIPDTENAFFKWPGKETSRFLRNQNTRGFCGFGLVFQTVFGMFLAHLVCLKTVK